MNMEGGRCPTCQCPGGTRTATEQQLVCRESAATSPAALLLAMTVQATDKEKVVDWTRRHSRAEIDCFATLCVPVNTPVAAPVLDFACGMKSQKFLKRPFGPGRQDAHGLEE